MKIYNDVLLVVYDGFYWGIKIILYIILFILYLYEYYFFLKFILKFY